MRRISNFKDNEMREDQLNVLIDVLSDIKNKKDPQLDKAIEVVMGK